MDELDIALKEKFGLDSFRPKQREVVEALLNKRDTLLVMPTGGGKSLCFQLPALLRNEITLVISPLIALMEDQVTALQSKGLPATFINSSLTGPELRSRIAGIMDGRYSLVYIAPERFGNDEFMSLMDSTKVGMLVVDEAHCVSQWGHDFRPDYRRINLIRERLGNPTILGATATATPEVRQDIIEQLAMKDPFVMVTGFDRPNLALKGASFETPEVRNTRFYDFCDKIVDEAGDKTPPAVVVYCTSRRDCEMVSYKLNTDYPGLSEFYHADMDSDERKKVQENFLEGRTPWIVATIAFGMGIDKPDIRYVLHYTIPGSVEAYYQEVGRAGRDGKPSSCNLFYTPKDVTTREFFIKTGTPTREVFLATYNTILRKASPGRAVKATYEDVATAVYGTDWMAGELRGMCKTALTRLKYAGAFLAPRRGYIQLPRVPLKFEEFQIDYQEIQDRRKRDLARLEKMKGLIAATDKKKFILDYFGANA